MASEYKSQSFGHSDGCHEIRNRQEQVELTREPLIYPVVLTLGAVPVFAGMIAVMDLVACFAEIFLAAHVRNSAGSDMVHGLPMRREYGL